MIKNDTLNRPIRVIFKNFSQKLLKMLFCVKYQEKLAKKKNMYGNGELPVKQWHITNGKPAGN